MSDKPLDGMRILLMEDEALIAMDVEQLCRDNGAAEVVILRNLEQAAREVDDPAKFHAAIVDAMLGGDPTTDFARRLLAANVPFVFATGYTDSDWLFREFPNVAIVGKPYGGEDLVAAVAAAIEGARIAPADPAGA